MTYTRVTEGESGERERERREKIMKQTLPECQDCEVLAAIFHSQTAGEAVNDVPNQQGPTVRKVVGSAETVTVMADEETLPCTPLAFQNEIM